ncbi:hypothetical protein VKT23_017494 [Stygiomarasmius scandens]|uniref:Uncharacterized protein n=1 Tax=Marasmiellus scandens TaxID=2682957 RepID=A0ABR1IRZ3_9AGAR
MSNTNTSLPPHALAFCKMFPEGRLCRFVNRRSGTLLDVRPDLNLASDEIPKVVCNPESVGVQYWIITPHGDGQAIIPVPRDGSFKVRYLTPSSLRNDVPVTVSPLPVSWIIFPTADSPKDNPLTPVSVPHGLYEEWTCEISWPHFRNQSPCLLHLWYGSPDADTKVVLYPTDGGQWEFWQVQFIRQD